MDIQRDALMGVGVEPEHIFEEHASGAKSNRPALENAIRMCREHDTLIVWRLDRLGRNLPELIRILDRLKAKGVGFRSLNEAIDTTTAVGAMVFHMMGAVAQFERDLLVERTTAGLKAARARGRRGGRKRKLTDAKVRTIAAMLKDEHITMGEIAAAFNVSKPTIYRELRNMEDQKLAGEIKETLKQREEANRQAAKKRAEIARNSQES